MPERTRTSDLQVRNLTLYPLSYGHTRVAVAEREGFEPSEEEIPFNGLANRRTRPLCDLSESGADDSICLSGPGLRQPVGIPSPLLPTSPPPIETHPRDAHTHHRFSRIRQSRRGGAAGCPERGRTRCPNRALGAQGAPAQRGVGQRGRSRRAGRHGRIPAQGEGRVAHRPAVRRGPRQRRGQRGRQPGRAPARLQHRCGRRARRPGVDPPREHVAVAPPSRGPGRRWRGAGRRGGPARERIPAHRRFQPPSSPGGSGGRALRPGRAGDGPPRAAVARDDHRVGAEPRASSWSTPGVGARRRREPAPRRAAAGRAVRPGPGPARDETPLLREAAKRGGTVANGQASFLVAQTAAFELWNGMPAPADVMRAALASTWASRKKGSPSSATEPGEGGR